MIPRILISSIPFMITRPLLFPIAQPLLLIGMSPKRRSLFNNFQVARTFLLPSLFFFSRLFLRFLFFLCHFLLLFLLLLRLLFGSSHLLEARVGPLQDATGMNDVQSHQGEKHRDGIEHILIPLMGKDWICGRCALGILADSEDDSNLYNQLVSNRSINSDFDSGFAFHRLTVIIAKAK